MLGGQLLETQIVHQPPGITDHAIDRPTSALSPAGFCFQVQIPKGHNSPGRVCPSEVPQVLSNEVVPGVVPPKLLRVGRIDVGQKLVPVFDVGLLIRLAKPFIPLAGGMEGGLLTFPDHSHTGIRNPQPNQGGNGLCREGCGERPQGEGGISACSTASSCACSTDDVPSVARPGCFSSMLKKLIRNHFSASFCDFRSV